MPERDSFANTLLVAIGLSLVCSLLVAGTAVLLKPNQLENAERFNRRTILDVAGLYEPGVDIDGLFASFEVRTVDLSNGQYVDAMEVGVDVPIPDELDLARIHRRARFQTVYILRTSGDIEQVILPVYGSGLWSTMRGYLAVAADGTTIRGLGFYEHGETPGLGDQIDDAEWRTQWSGKRIYDDQGNARIEVVRGTVHPGAAAVYQVDGISGATLTGKGVTDLVRYWTGPHGFGAYLGKLREQFDAAR
ncbi:MAG: Na(+)-translocating NADH-quinone reductase subunit C [Woeseiaceae bacterium]|nr:Na(+)-translocating NADH-quinone reductase subunit C [Woeseiaceae bacterium]